MFQTYPVAGDVPEVGTREGGDERGEEEEKGDERDHTEREELRLGGLPSEEEDGEGVARDGEGHQRHAHVPRLLQDACVSSR